MKSHKSISAGPKGIIISFENTKKHQWISYENKYVSKMEDQIFDQPIFNENQQKIYSQVVYGLNCYNKEELQTIPKSIKNLIFSKYVKAQNILNTWKYEIVEHRVDNLLSTLFPNSSVVKKINSVKSEKSEKNYSSFKDLKISKKMIAEKLIFEGLLPKNFFTL